MVLSGPKGWGGMVPAAGGGLAGRWGGMVLLALPGTAIPRGTWNAAFMAKAADIRAMEPAALDEYFAGMDMLAPLVGTLQRGVDGGLLVDMIADQQSAHVQALRPFFTVSATNAQG